MTSSVIGDEARAQLLVAEGAPARRRRGACGRRLERDCGFAAFIDDPKALSCWVARLRVDTLRPGVTPLFITADQRPSRCTHLCPGRGARRGQTKASH